MRSATFPRIRVEPEVRAEVESVLREGESLTPFVEEAVLAAAAWRRVQSAFVSRGESAIGRWKEGAGSHAVGDVLDVELELASETPDRAAPQRALDAIGEGIRLPSWSPSTCRRAELGNKCSRERIVPFGSTGCVVLFEILGEDAVVGAARHQREDDCHR